ncbi:unnamed protein product [Calypogeia fissa]
MEDQKLLPNGNSRPSSRSGSISPRLSLKPRPSLAQTEEYEDEETGPLPSTPRDRSSVQVEDDKEIDSFPSPRHIKSSMQLEDNQDLDSNRLRPSSKHQSFLQEEDFEDEDFDPPHPSTSKRKSLMKMDVDQKDGERSSITKRLSQVGPNIMDNLKRLSLGRQQTSNDEEASTSNEEGPSINKRRRSTKRGSQVVERKPSIVVDDEGTNEGKDFAINERRRSTKRGSLSVERQPSIVANEESEEGGTPNTNERRRSLDRGSQIVERKPSIAENDERRESRRDSSLGDFRRKSSSAKQGSDFDNDEFGRKPSTQGERRDSIKKKNRLKRESSLGLGAELAESDNITFKASEDEEDM